MSVVWQHVDGADDVEAPLGELPAADRPGPLRRWLWAPALVAAGGLYVARRLVENPSGVLELWLFMGVLAALMVTAVAALVRYRDDQRLAAETAASAAFATGARAATGSVTVRERSTSSGTLLSGLLTYPTGDGTAEATWSMMLRAGDETEPPRDGDPVAVWWAPGTDTVVARYQRDWADALRRRAEGR
ncbi:hypothetical protein [Isoptericola sp. BMS4]|uniref:hypothetical protein n=1 Tax=Isoptericola sp. BMS4 TaxID=2527875 RepID=UPI00141FBB5C|nr:hypothetical protein [Isoptericola sp. BMS4]